MDPAIDRQTDAVRALARASSVLERSSPELSLAHYRILSAIAGGHERASHVAARLALGKPTVSAAVEALSQRRLIERFDFDGDQRASVLRVTAAGQALLSDVEEKMRERLRELCERTPDGEQLLEALVWLGEAVDEWRAERRAGQLPAERPRGGQPDASSPRADTEAKAAQ